MPVLCAKNKRPPWTRRNFRGFLACKEREARAVGVDRSRKVLKLVLFGLAIGAASIPIALRHAGQAVVPPAQTGAHRQDVVLREEALETVPNRSLYRPRALRPPPGDPALAVVDGTATFEGATQLRRLVARGVSQGFDGLLYDNRDRDHSPLARSLFPALGHVVYGPTLRRTNWDYGLAQRIVLPPPLIGNSSTALTAGPIRRSQVRHAMTSPGGPEAAFAQYEANSLYIYPEHRDHDDVDLYPAQWPYTVTSQGSSGSDRPFMRVLLMTLAAFPAETRAALEQNGLIAPALQMILRRNLDGVNRPGDYLGPRAHPTVFDAADLRPGRMIAMAAAMRPGDVPPMVRLSVVRDPFLGVADFAGRSERLYDTPSAIARIWRGLDWSRDVVLSAADTVDPNGRALRFHWVLLRGDPARVGIDIADGAGEEARITLNWHEAYSAPQHRPGRGPAPMTSRVDIAVFADNGVHVSAPAIFSVSFPTHQIRQYEPGPDGKMRLASVDYDAAARGAPYDPVLHWSAPWRDQLRYDPSGFLFGWDRHQGGRVDRFSATGRRSDGLVLRYDLPRGLRDDMILSAVPQTD